METKKCIKCKKFKSRSEFYLRNKKGNWISAECKVCSNQTRRKNKEKKLGRKLQKANPHYTKDEKKMLVEMYNGGTSYDEMSKIFSGRTKHALESKLYELGITSRREYFLRRRTSIENFVENILEEGQMKFELEYNFNSYYYDFKVNTTLIEVQGSYWHCDPKTKKTKNITHREAFTVKRDLEKKKIALENGFDIIYIWEYDINKNPKKVKQQLIAVLQSNLQDNHRAKSVELLRDKDNTEVTRKQLVP